MGDRDDGEGLDLICRRAQGEDALPIRVLIGEDYENFDNTYGEYSVKQVIETSYFSVSATDEEDNVLGFAAFNDFPALTTSIPGDSWVSYLTENCKEATEMHSSNTLWLTFFVASEQAADNAINNIFATLYTTLPDIDHVLFALPKDATPNPVIEEYFSELECSDSSVFDGTIYWSPRQHVIPDLVIRKGKVEDYDDLMPLLLAEVGVMTEMGDDFYLEELLEHQDAMRGVLVAEDAETSEIVGLMCLSSTTEDQQYVVKHFNFEPYQKLKRWYPRQDQAHGNKNCFQINFFYLNPEYECRAVDFLRPAFQEFPFAEYCFVRLPHSIPDHALLSKFQYVPLKQGLTQKSGCFVVSRYVLDNLEVRKAVADDVPRLSHLLTTQSEVSRQRSDLTAAHMKSCCGSESGDSGEFSVTLLHKGNVVGVLGVRGLGDEETFDYVAQYDVDSKIDFLAANKRGDDEYMQIGLEPREAPLARSAALPGLLVKFFYIKPIFRSFTRTFLRECLRILKSDVLYYAVGLQDEVSSTLLSELTLALPRREMHRPGEPVGEEEERELVTLHFTSRRLLSEFKTKIHSRIVVIGASATGLSFISTLLALPYIHFSNIVLISRDGIPEHPSRIDYTWFTNTLNFLERQYMLFKLKCKVRIIEGSLVDFERTEKYVVTDNGFVEPYDHLVITAGRQYTVPKDLSLAKNLGKNGVFPLSNQVMIEKLKQHVRDSEVYEDDMSSCVIYGSSLDSYCVMTSLIQLGVKPSRLVLVSPMNLEGSIFKDPIIDLKVDKLCESLGIKIYKNHELERLEYNDDNTLTAIHVLNMGGSKEDTDFGENIKKVRSLEIPCTMFIYCHEKDIDPAILSALNKRSIVFDGRVIVENNYRTTDRQIYAAGPIAMFSRRFGPSEPFETFSSMEVGRKLCHTVLGFLGVEEFKSSVTQDDEDEKDGIDREQLRKERRGQLFSDEADALAKDGQGMAEEVQRPKPLPTYTDNTMVSVLLPNNYHYFHCQTHDAEQVHAVSPNNISTEDENGDSYIQLSVGSSQYIQAISYLGSMEIEVHNFKVLVGLPQTYLNIVQRWDDGLIQDVVQFLRQSWTMAVYYDKFQKFVEGLKEKFRKQKDVQMLGEYIMQHVQAEAASHIEDSRRKRYGLEVTPETQHMVELELIKFLHQNKEFLPIYFLPDVSMYV